MKNVDDATLTRYRALFFILGAYLLGGATYTFATHRWFAGFFPFLDVLGILPLGRYIEAAVAAMVGIAFVALSLTRRLPRWMSDSATRKRT
jgi:hypothetical protein